MSEGSPDHDTSELAQAIARISEGRNDEGQIRQVTALATRSAKDAGAKAVASGKWLADVTLEMAGHINVRDLPTLQLHHRGLAGPLLSDILIRNAALATGAIGAATGAFAAASELTPATWATLPLELAAETLLVVAIEMKLVAELHAAAGVPLPTGFREKGPLVAKSWSESRGVRPDEVFAVMRAAGAATATAPLSAAAATLLGRSARDQLTQQLRRRLVRRTGKNIFSLTPLLIGAAVGATLNRKATRRLGHQVATSLGIAMPR